MKLYLLRAKRRAPLKERLLFGALSLAGLACFVVGTIEQDEDHRYRILAVGGLVLCFATLLVFSSRNPINLAGETRSVDFVWLWLREDDGPQDTRIARAKKISRPFKTTTSPGFPPVVPFWLGMFRPLDEPGTERQQFVEALQREFGRDAKLLHGRIPVLSSSNVSRIPLIAKTRFVFDVKPDWRSVLLSELCALEFGHYREYEHRHLQKAGPAADTG